MTDKITSPAPARADIGAEMANVMFNFAQRAGHTLTSDDAVLFDKLRKRWDAAPAQAPVAEHGLGWQQMGSAPRDGATIVIRYPLQGNVKKVVWWNRVMGHWAGPQGAEFPESQKCEWSPVLADTAPQAPQPCEQCGMTGGHKLQCSYRPDGPVVLPAVRARAPQQENQQ